MYQFVIPNMSCSGCARSVTKALQGVDASAEIDANFAKHQVRVDSPADEALLRAALEAAGYPAIETNPAA